MPLSPDQLKQFKKPFGILIPDSHINKDTISLVLKDAAMVIAVGDRTTERLEEFGIIPDIAVVDGQEKRFRRDFAGKYDADKVRCKNPAGSITKEAIEVLEKCIAAKKPVRVLVDGEEDLLALPLFIMAPDGSVVLYGQPNEGMVAVKIDEAKRKESKDLMSRTPVD